MSQDEPLFVRLDISVDGVQGPSHIAELHPMSSGEFCRIGRLLELSDGSHITGGINSGHVFNLTAMPARMVPHPRTYSDFDGVEATELSRDEFEAFWSEAAVMLPELFPEGS